MRSSLVVLAAVLLILTAVAPAIEVIAGCLEICPEEAPGGDRCASDVCCSCCVHAGPLFASLPLPTPTLDLHGPATSPDGPTAAPGPPSSILHVPKLLAA